MYAGRLCEANPLTHLEPAEEFIKRHAQQLGERLVLLVMRFLVLINVTAVRPGMRITSPGINGITAGSSLGFRDGLAESAVRNIVMRSQLQDNTRILQLHQKHGKWNVLIPSRLFEQPLRGSANSCLDSNALKS